MFMQYLQRESKERGEEIESESEGKHVKWNLTGDQDGACNLNTPFPVNKNTCKTCRAESCAD